MELRDLLADGEFLGRRNNAKRASRRFEALQALARVFVEPPNVVLQKLGLDVAVEFCGADSAGISLEEADERRFRWVAIAGTFFEIPARYDAAIFSVLAEPAFRVGGHNTIE